MSSSHGDARYKSSDAPFWVDAITVAFTPMYDASTVAIR
jgi:hypothetical protein